MLAGDYPCAAYIGNDRGQSTSCYLCKIHEPDRPSPTEDMIHILTACRATSYTRAKYIPELLNTLAKIFPENALLNSRNQSQLAQFLLDPTSLNLPQKIRVSPVHPGLCNVLSMCRITCYAIHRDRTKQMTQYT